MMSVNSGVRFTHLVGCDHTQNNVSVAVQEKPGYSYNQVEDLKERSEPLLTLQGSHDTIIFYKYREYSVAWNMST